MSTWLRPACLFEYPAVEYIPLWVQPLGLWHIAAVAPFGPSLSPVHDVNQLSDILARLGIAPPALPLDWGRSIVVVAWNCEATECFYRGFKATLIGSRRAGLVQLFALPTERMYKDWVQLALYDAAGQPIADAFCPVPGRTATPARRERADAG